MTDISGEILTFRARYSMYVLDCKVYNLQSHENYVNMVDGSQPVNWTRMVSVWLVTVLSDCWASNSIHLSVFRHAVMAPSLKRGCSSFSLTCYSMARRMAKISGELDLDAICNILLRAQMFLIHGCQPEVAISALWSMRNCIDTFDKKSWTWGETVFCSYCAFFETK